MNQLVHSLIISVLTLPLLEAEYQEPEKIMESFEDGIPGGLEADGVLSLDAKRVKQGTKSLKWEWIGNGKIVFNTPIGYRKQREITKENAKAYHADAAISGVYERPRGVFMWVYNESATPQRMRIEFGRGDEVDCWFDYNLQFKGWRTIQVIYDRGDMNGTPREDMTRMTMIAPNTGSGTFYFDMIGLAVPVLARTVSPNPQLPELDPHARLATQYASLLYKQSQYTPSFNLEPMTDDLVIDFHSMEKKAIGYWNDGSAEVDLRGIRKRYELFEIIREGDNIYGRPLTNRNIINDVFSERKVSKEEAWKGMLGWRSDLNTVILSIATAWYNSNEKEEKAELEEMFINLFDYSVDQGFDAGAGLGWINHYSYVIREYAPAMLMMKEVLRKNGRLEKAVEICKWFYTFGQVYREDVVYGCEGRISGDADEMQGILTQRLIAVLLMEDSPEKTRDLRHFSSYYSNIKTAYANALDETYKPDGTSFRHAGHTHSYGGRAIFGAVRTYDILRGTAFEPTEASRKRSAKVVRTYYDTMFTDKVMTPKAFSTVRFSNYIQPGQFDGMLELLDESYEPLDGFRSLSYSCVGLNRQKNYWMITTRTHSKYVYPFESWGRNYFAFPLFIANGYTDVSYPDSIDSVTPEGGIWYEGYDWRRWPGATTVRLPYEDFACRIGQVRDEGGEYLFSDQPFSGGVESSYNCGIHVFQFRGHQKYGIESFTGRKSWFFVGNKVLCLGSDISSDISDHAVETVLFQNHISDLSKSLVLDGDEIAGVPFDHQVERKNVWLIDSRGTGYFVPNARLNITRAEQSNPQHQYNGEQTKGMFSTAWIDHGRAPKNVGYEYVIVAGASADEMHVYANDPSIEVIQKDNAAHVVELWDERATAYAVYAEEGARFEKGLVKAVSKQSTFLVKSEGRRLRLSVSDPDLNIYEGQDDLLPDGSRTELSVYEREWFYWPSRENTVRLTISGTWKLDSVVKPMETVEVQPRVVSSENGETVIEFVCRDGLSSEILLSR